MHLTFIPVDIPPQLIAVNIAGRPTAAGKLHTQIFPFQPKCQLHSLHPNRKLNQDPIFCHCKFMASKWASKLSSLSMCPRFIQKKNKEQRSTEARTENNKGQKNNLLNIAKEKPRSSSLGHLVDRSP